MDVCFFHSFRGTGRTKFFHAFFCNNRAIFLWLWNENARAKQKQQKNLNRVIWLVYRTDTNARRFWLVKRILGWKYYMPEIFLQINRYFALTSYCNTIGQANNTFSILGFLWRENEEAMFWSFYPLADKSNLPRSRSYGNHSIVKSTCASGTKEETRERSSFHSPTDG